MGTQRNTEVKQRQRLFGNNMIIHFGEMEILRYVKPLIINMVVRPAVLCSTESLILLENHKAKINGRI